MDRTLRGQLAALLPHYGLRPQLRARPPTAPVGPVLQLHSIHRLTVHIDEVEIALSRWSVEDVVHAIDVASGRVAGGAHLALGRLEVVGTESEVSVAGCRVPLTRTERRILRHLLRRPAVVHSRDHLVAHVWPIGYRGRTDVVDTYVSYVRRKLRDGYRLTIRTSYGAGYSLHAP